MFEEICLVCSKQLTDQRAYCSDDCQNEDFSDPSISSSSSALSSPHMPSIPGDDIPPFALASALRSYNRIHVASDDDPYDYDDDALQKSAIYRPGLSFARRPSGTNNHSTVPRLHHRRLSSGAGPGAGAGSGAPSTPGFPRSAPTHTEYEYEETVTARPRRTPNRTSLPACFSLLQVSAPSPVSSVRTISRPSPPTPRPAPPATFLPPPAPPPAQYEPVFRRGREPTRRTSSAPRSDPSPSPSGSERRARGRARVDDYADAPGFGTGRSGLVHRERPRLPL